jgi:hypothetical protein
MTKKETEKSNTKNLFPVSAILGFMALIFCTRGFSTMGNTLAKMIFLIL